MEGHRIRPPYSRVGGVATSSVELKIVSPLSRDLLGEDSTSREFISQMTREQVHCIPSICLPTSPL